MHTTHATHSASHSSTTCRCSTRHISLHCDSLQQHLQAAVCEPLCCLADTVTAAAACMCMRRSLLLDAVIAAAAAASGLMRKLKGQRGSRATVMRRVTSSQLLPPVLSKPRPLLMQRQLLELLSATSEVLGYSSSQKEYA
eukprot:12327-Heterococcus_DN1.PRE.3